MTALVILAAGILAAYAIVLVAAEVGR